MAGKWSNWMANLPSELWSFPLCSLAIPGSHNSLSFYADREANVDSNIVPIFRQYLEDFGELATEISHRWTKTQSTTVTQQLDLGIRYFDIRVTARSGDDKNVFFRNGPNILQILKELRKWSDKHPQEVILLDFRVVNRLTPAQHRYLLANMTQDLFEDKMLTCSGHVQGVTLRNMWAVGAQLLVFYPTQCVYDYKTVWPNEYLGNFIFDSQTAKDMVHSLDARHTKGRPAHMFYCLNGAMTPNNEYLAANLDQTLEDKMSKPALRAIINWIRDKDIRQRDINIIVADFVNMYDFCKEVIQVNYGVRKLKRYDFERAGAPDERMINLLWPCLASSFGQDPVEAGNMFEWVYNVIEKLVALKSDNTKQDSKIEQLEANLQDARTMIDMLKHSQQKPVISTYVRWGKTECPAEAQKVYGGYAAGSKSGHSGSGANILCLPSQPVWGTYNDIEDPQATLNGVDYKFGGMYEGHEAPCALCSMPRASSVMIPGRNVCYDGWKIEYSGYLASTKTDGDRSEYICLDENFEALGGPHDDIDNGVHLYHVEARCRSLPCDVYPHGREVTCAVCSYSPKTSNYVPYA